MMIGMDLQVYPLKPGKSNISQAIDKKILDNLLFVYA